MKFSAELFEKIKKSTGELSMKLNKLITGFKSISHAKKARAVSLASIGACCLCAIYIFTLNVAFAVSVDGELVGYAENAEEINELVSSVTDNVSGILGYDYDVSSSVDCQIAIGNADGNIIESVEEAIYGSFEGIDKYTVLSVDGVPFCAFNSTEEAAEALNAYIAHYTNDNTTSVKLMNEVTIANDYADSALLTVGNNFADEAVSVIKVKTVETEVTLEEIPYDTEYTDDDTLFEDEVFVYVEGVEGKAEVACVNTYINGVLAESEESGRLVLSEPSAALARKGTRQRLSVGSYIWPAEGELTSYFGRRSVAVGSSYHLGIDIANDYSTDIIAADGGTVIVSEWFDDFGYKIEIKHDNGDVTYYAHCSELLVEEGDIVSQGQLIARMGCTGVASGVHLHFEYHPKGGNARDPLNVLP